MPPTAREMGRAIARRPRAGERAGLIPELVQHRAWLTGHCRRILGSAFDAEDAAQETLVKAWLGLDDFERRASSRTWMYRIATNVCLDLLAAQRRRAQPIDLRSGSPAESPPDADHHGRWDAVDPADLAVRRESIRLAFVAAHQHLPPRQRTALILCDVLRWTSVDVAERLGTTVAAVNSARQRARTTLATRDLTATSQTPPPAAAHDTLLTRYVDAFDRFDIDTLVSLLHEDATG
jgi:RNA polymerase sigma-70 factor, ECF subfamily